MDLTKVKKEKVISPETLGYKCSCDGKNYYGFTKKKCWYCVPVQDQKEWAKLEKRG